MEKEYSFFLKEKQYNYLLPVFGKCAYGRTRLLYHNNKHYFIGTYDGYIDALNRCKYL